MARSRYQNPLRPDWKRPSRMPTPAPARPFFVLWLILLALGGPAPGQGASPCDPEFRGQAVDFERCVVLDSQGDFSLAWTLQKQSRSRVLQFWFQGSAEVPYTWAGWGVSPSGGMVGSQVVVGYANPRHTDTARAESLFLAGRAPTTFRTNGSDSPLRPIRESLELEWREGGRVLRLMGNATWRKRGAAARVIWRGGQAVLDYELGVLGPHMNTSKESRSINFATGNVSDILLWTPKNLSTVTSASLAADAPEARVNSSCKYTVRGKKEVFAKCTFLDPSGRFSLAWTPDNATGVLRFRFSGTPEAPNGWAGWGVSPEGGRMVGSDVVVGYAAGNDTSSVRARPYHLGGPDPEYFQVDTTSGPFQVVNGSLAVNFVAGGKRAVIVGNATGLLQGPVWVIWRGGPGMLDLEKGLPSPHLNFTKARRMIDFASGNASVVETAPFPAAGTRAIPLLSSLLVLAVILQALVL